MRGTTIECHPSGTYFDFLNPRADMVHVEDIALALSNTARFGGHSRRFYSVAEHALLVHRLVADVADAELAYAALHHDSHEAYLGDIPTPLKNLLGSAVPRLASLIDEAIGWKLSVDLDLAMHDIVKAADEQALWIEAGVLKRSRGIGAPWGHSRTDVPEVPTGAVACHAPPWAEAQFLSAHYRAYAAVLAAREPLTDDKGKGNLS